MIVFDLRCGNAHVFEAWFGSSADYDGQRTRGLIECPLCGDDAVAKAAMAPAVPRKGNATRVAPPTPPVAAASTAPGAGAAADAAAVPPPAGASDDLACLLAAQRRLEAASSYVGTAFAAEARAMHDGDSDGRAIHGEATRAEALALIRDGIAVAPLPFRPLASSDA